MDHDDISRAMSVAAAAATAVSPYLLEGFRAATEVQLKGPIDLVTAYDVGAEARLREALSAALPYRIVGEESGTSGDPGSGAVWYVDPIDGTTNFAHGHPFFCVSIGLYDDDGVSLAGVIHAPALGVTWARASPAGRPRCRAGRRCRPAHRRLRRPDLRRATPSRASRCRTERAGSRIERWSNGWKRHACRCSHVTVKRQSRPLPTGDCRLD